MMFNQLDLLLGMIKKKKMFLDPLCFNGLRRVKLFYLDLMEISDKFVQVSRYFS